MFKSKTLKRVIRAHCLKSSNFSHSAVKKKNLKTWRGLYVFIIYRHADPILTLVTRLESLLFSIVHGYAFFLLTFQDVLKVSSEDCKSVGFCLIWDPISTSLYRLKIINHILTNIIGALNIIGGINNSKPNNVLANIVLLQDFREFFLFINK